jgi:hypothetical protein
MGTGGYIIPVWTMGLVKRKFGWQADALHLDVLAGICEAGWKFRVKIMV